MKNYKLSVAPDLEAYYTADEHFSDNGVTNSGMMSKNFLYVENIQTKEKYQNCLDTYIYVYENRVNKWFFDWGKAILKLDNNQNSGFVILQIAISQIEDVEQFRRGELSLDRSNTFFCDGIKRIFNISDNESEWLKTFYSLFRCGLFHCGITRENVLIENTHKKAIEYDKTSNVFHINPILFLETVIKDFTKYICELKDKTNIKLRDNFEKKWKSENEQCQKILKN